MSDHGKVVGHIRRCDAHGEHGPLYPCPEYDRETLANIAGGTARYMSNLRDPAWRERQIANGMPPVVMAAFMAMAGVEPTPAAPAPSDPAPPPA